MEQLRQYIETLIESTGIPITYIILSVDNHAEIHFMYDNLRRAIRTDSHKSETAVESINYAVNDMVHDYNLRKKKTESE